MFHLVSLFEEDVGPDRLSDMIATIIEPEIIKYTLRIMRELDITQQKYPEKQFRPDGLVQNTFKNTAIFFLPKEILHELPIAKDWDDIDFVVTRNRIIRQEISAEIGTLWRLWAATDKKKYLRERIFLQPDVCSRVIAGYCDQDIDPYDINNNSEYLADVICKRLKKTMSFNDPSKNISSLEAVHKVIGIFKDWTENNRGWAEIQDAPTKKREKTVQRLVHLAAKHYVEINNFDISFEPDEGRGPLDLKLSRGADKAIAEIKLSTNQQYLHGFEQQIEEYGAAEKTKNLVYVFVDVGNPIRRDRLNDLYRTTYYSGKPCPELIIIDACPKKAASTYDSGTREKDQVSIPKNTRESMEVDFDSISGINPDEFEMLDLESFPEIELEDFPVLDFDNFSFEG